METETLETKENDRPTLTFNDVGNTMPGRTGFNLETPAPAFDPDDLPDGTWLASEGQIVSVTDSVTAALIEYKRYDDLGRRLDPPYRLPEPSEEHTPQVIRQGVSGEDVGIIVAILVLLLITAISTAIFYHEHPPVSETWKPNDAAVIISQQEAAKAQNEYGRAQAEYGAAAIHRETALRLQVIENCTKSGNIPVMMGGNVDCKLGPTRFPALAPK